MQFHRALIALLLLICASFTSPAQAAKWEASAAPEPISLPAPPEVPGDWVTREGLHAKVHSHPDDARAAARLAEHAEVAIPEIAKRLQIPSGPKTEIYLADTQSLFQTLQPGTPPSWADGTAWPHQALIFLRSPRVRPGTADPLEQVLEHEIVHVLLGQAFGPRKVPRWLQEGLAQVEAGEYSPEVSQRLAAGLLGGGLHSIEDLTTGFPSDPVRASLAYAQSADLIAFINAEYGTEAIPALIRELSQGAPVGAAFRRATGDSVEEIDAGWRRRLQQAPIWLQPLTSDGAFWVIAAGVFLLAAGAVRRRNKVKLDRWSREEALQDALYRTIERSMGDPRRRPGKGRRAPPDDPVIDLQPRDPGGPWIH